MEKRKKDHISLAFQNRIDANEIDNRFYYEPLLSAHPGEAMPEISFLGKKLHAPIWISSMAGGSHKASKINTNLALVAHKFGMGMGLGSCRILMDSDSYLADFDLRTIIGWELPFYANLGIAQIESLMEKGDYKAITDLVNLLSTDGLIIHVNPMQEWLQPEGDRLNHSPIDIITEVLQNVDFPIIVKEVGQGFGYESIRQIMKLPLEAVEFAAFGGTNFAKMELMRNLESNKELYEPLSYVGHSAEDMVNILNRATHETSAFKTNQVIISGGIGNFLDGYYVIRKSEVPAIYGMASTFLKYAKEDYQLLEDFAQNQINGLKMAYSYLTVR